MPFLFLLFLSLDSWTVRGGGGPWSPFENLWGNLARERRIPRGEDEDIEDRFIAGKSTTDTGATDGRSRPCHWLGCSQVQPVGEGSKNGLRSLLLNLSKE
jgi:hypothetical protein